MDSLGKECFRNITFTDKAQQNIKNLSKQFPKFDDILHAVYAVLENYAHSGRFLKSPNYYVYKTGKAYKIPSFGFYYSLNDNSVIIHRIEQVPEEE